MAASGITYSDEVLPPARTLIARANLSHRWDEAAKMIPKARYFWSPFIEFGLADLVRMRMSRFERSLIRLCRGCRRERFCLSPRSHRARPSTTAWQRRPTGSEKLRKKLAADVEIGHESFCLDHLGIAMCRMSLLRPIRGFGVPDRGMSKSKGTQSLTVAVLKARFSRERANFVCGASPNDSRPDRHFRALHDGRG